MKSGDEEAILKKLQVRQVDCKYVGSYFVLRDELIFVEFEIFETSNPNFKEGIYFSRKDGFIRSKYIIKETFLRKKMLSDWIVKVSIWFDKLQEVELSEKYSKFIEIK